MWQRRWLEESGILNQQLAYWQKKLAGVPETLDVAADYPHPGVPSFAGASYTFTLDARLTEQLKRWANNRQHAVYGSAGRI